MGVRRRALAMGTAIAAVCALTAGAAAAVPTARTTTTPGQHAGDSTPVQILALNDFHGHLEPSGSVGSDPAGGAEYLASHLEQLREGQQHSTTVAAGDLIGASPLLSAAFYDEPTIEAMTSMGLSAASVGNHEFDAGWQELLRKQNGGCLDEDDPNRDSCPNPRAPFEGAGFDYLSANVFHEATNETLLPPYSIQEFGPAKVAFIGMTLEDTPNIVTAEGVQGLEFTDEVETANALVPKLKADGVQAIVVLLHEGGFSADPDRYNDCPEVSGPVIDIAEKLAPEIDAVISGHTHQPYICSIPDPDGEERLVTSASYYGTMVTEMTLPVDQLTGDVLRDQATASNHVMHHRVDQEPSMTKLIDKYSRLVEPVADRVIGHLTTEQVTVDQDDSYESPLGNLVADTMLADESVVTDQKRPEVAFMNYGGIRADLRGEGPDHAVTFGNAFTVQPFSNYSVSMDLTGEQILQVLDQQWTGGTPGEDYARRMLQIAGLTYTWSDGDRPAVVPGSVRISGESLQESRTYRVVTNHYLAAGSEGFTTFGEGANVYFGGVDIDALSTYLEANDPYQPVPTDRIDVQ